MLAVLVPTSICRRLCSPCICTTHLPDWMVAVGDHTRAGEEGNGACVCSQCCLVGLHHDKHCVVRVSCVCSLAHATAVTTLFGDKAFGRESREKFARGKAMPERSQRVARRSAPSWQATRRPLVTLSPAITRARRCTAVETAACAARARLPLLPAPAAAQLQRPPFLTKDRLPGRSGRRRAGRATGRTVHSAPCSLFCGLRP